MRGLRPPVGAPWDLPRLQWPDDRWITYGTQSTNTFSVQAIDGAGNRSPASSVTLTNQTC